MWTHSITLFIMRSLSLSLSLRERETETERDGQTDREYGFLKYSIWMPWTCTSPHWKGLWPYISKTVSVSLSLSFPPLSRSRPPPPPSRPSLPPPVSSATIVYKRLFRSAVNVAMRRSICREEERERGWGRGGNDRKGTNGWIDKRLHQMHF